MSNLTMHRSDWLAIALILGAAVASVVMIVMGANGCTPKNNAAFAADVALCEQAPTCADAVLCRKAVAEKYGRPFSGHCEPYPTDAGGQ